MSTQVVDLLRVVQLSFAAGAGAGRSDGGECFTLLAASVRGE